MVSFITRALPAGPKRDHFLAHATPEKMAELKQQDETLWEPSDYGKPSSLLTGYAPSAAWAWLRRGEEVPNIIGFNDV